MIVTVVILGCLAIAGLLGFLVARKKSVARQAYEAWQVYKEETKTSEEFDEFN